MSLGEWAALAAGFTFLAVVVALCERLDREDDEERREGRRT